MASKRKTEAAIKPPDITKAERIKDPAVLGAVVVNTYNRINKGNGQAPDLKETMQAIMADIAKVNRGDLSDIEAMLTGQAIMLQGMFAEMALRASEQTQLKHYQAFFNMAMKAQAQSRSTIQALVELKYPRQVVITKQANISNGHQQVNNGQLSDQYACTRGRARAREIPIASNELLEIDNETTGQRLDTRATQGAIREDQAMATVAAQHGRKNSRR